MILKQVVLTIRRTESDAKIDGLQKLKKDKKASVTDLPAT